MSLTATYSPDDNKLRIYASTRLDAETYQRVTAAGFKNAPKQGCFVAPMWTPAREDLALELCGEIEDDDTSLVERAEDRAERFSGYGANRANEADATRKAVRQIADGIPFGQPILVGHHSEGRARRDQDRIARGMQKTCELWKAAEHWQRRAESAIAHAKYKELPAVRTRRIGRIEADKRKQDRTRKASEGFLALWSRPELDREDALAVAERDHLSVRDENGEYIGTVWSLLDAGRITVDEAVQKAKRTHAAVIARAQRWADHFDARLTYERAMLKAQGGTVHDQKPAEKGGAIRCLFSPQYGKGWAYVVKVNTKTVTIQEATAYGGGKYNRTIAFDKIRQTMTAAEVEAARVAGQLVETEAGEGFFLATA